MKTYQFKGSHKIADKFAYPRPIPDGYYTEKELKVIFDRNCWCLKKYFHEITV